ncbi:MAG: uracil-DNA glycosylase [Rickettsiales bacterium]|jgi:DNA polymerase|nr:uracil-DNA glycosylase [Rickettsiales bacterium]
MREEIGLLRFFISVGADAMFSDTPVSLYNVVEKPKIQAQPPQPLAAVSVSAATEEAENLAAACTNPAEITKALETFSACPLRKFAGSAIGGIGAPAPKVLVLTEAPSSADDATGNAYSDDSGELLRRMLARANLSLDTDTFALPSIAYRPPGGRPPTDEEIATLKPFLLRHIELLKPRAIFALGQLPARMLLATDEPMANLRGHWSEAAGTPLMPTFSLAQLLANPEARKATWEDLQQVLDKII